MTKSRASLTELEGAILGVLRRAPGMTPYAVRKVFLESRSEAWSGSAGAVYPAIARLARQGLLTAGQSGDRRGTTAYRLSARGTRVQDRWLGDAQRACGLGTDPFRTRAALWAFLPGRQRRALLARVARETQRQRDDIAGRLSGRDPLEAATDALVVLQLDARLAWLAAA